MFEELIEQLIQYFSVDPYKEDFSRAKELYMRAVGTVVEEHAYFDTWISGFFEWYLVDYKMLKLGVPPIFLYQRMFSEKLDKGELEFLRDLEKSELSLFEIQSVSGQRIKAHNIFSKRSQEFFSHQNTALLHRGDYLITRVQQSLKRSQSFGVIWHLSGEVSSIVSKKIAKIKTPHEQELLIYELIKKKTQSEIYSHVPLDQIFGWKTEQRIHPTLSKDTA